MATRIQEAVVNETPIPAIVRYAMTQSGHFGTAMRRAEGRSQLAIEVSLRLLPFGLIEQQFIVACYFASFRIAASPAVEISTHF